MSQQAYHLIHANVAISRAPFDDPMMEGFINQVDEINSMAQASPGFVAQPELPDAGEVFAGRMLLNVSIWESVEDLRSFTHQCKHAQALEQRAEWFEQSEVWNYVLFWLPAGHTPSETDVRRRIEHLRKNGPTSYAFNFKQPFSIDDMLSSESEEGSN